MNIGLIFGILAGACFGISTVAARRALFQSGTPLGGVVISVPVSALLVLGVLLGTAQFETLWQLSRYSLIILAIAGVITSVAGRLLTFTGVQHLGANRNNALVRTSPLYAIFFGLIFLNESLTVLRISGVVLVLIGAMLVSVGNGEARRIRVKGVIAGLGAALCYAVTATLVKSVIDEVGSPAIAAFIVFAAASLVLASLMSFKQYRGALFQVDRYSLIIFVISGLLMAVGQLSRYTALSYSPISLVEPLVMSSSAIFVFVLSFLINRRIDVFTVRVILGIIATVVGIVLIFL